MLLATDPLLFDYQAIHQLTPLVFVQSIPKTPQNQFFHFHLYPETLPSSHIPVKWVKDPSFLVPATTLLK